MSLEFRAKALKKARAFFDERDFLEVDVPSLSPFADIDAYIDPMAVEGKGFLHTSPEYAMKQLVAQYAQNIYFLGHVFRKEEVGKWHSEEFTMIEWYRVGTTEDAFLSEVYELLALFLGPLPLEILDYETAWKQYAKPITIETIGWTEDEKRHYIWATSVEPNLGKESIVIIQNFPKQDASLAKLEYVEGKLVAKRFECFHKGIELGNGFYELSDPVEQKQRFEEANQKRTLLGKKAYPINPHLIQALAKGLPKNTYGMAIGFDRLLMLQEKTSSIHQILPLFRQIPL